MALWNCGARLDAAIAPERSGTSTARVTTENELRTALASLPESNGVIAFWHIDEEIAQEVLGAMKDKWPERLRGVIVFRAMSFAGFNTRPEAEAFMSQFSKRVHVLSYQVKRLASGSLETQQFKVFSEAVAPLDDRARVPYELLDPPPQPLLAQAYLVAVAWPHLSASERDSVKGTVSWPAVQQAASELVALSEPRSDDDARRLAEAIEELWK